jgi:F0F1-type ATP synthase assembly protein I
VKDADLPDPDREKQDRSKADSPGAARAMALMVDLGLRLAGPITIGVLVGVGLDRFLKTSPWLLFVGVLVGVGTAFYALYDVSRTYGNRKR